MENDVEGKTTLISSGNELPGAKLSIEKMPGHWLLARLGKRVLRPGGRRMTEKLVRNLKIEMTQDIVELAPGLGLTAKLLLGNSPLSYTAIERDLDAASFVRKRLTGYEQATVHVGKAECTGLGTACCDIVLGEAILTMQTTKQKEAIAVEAFRLLRQGGLYAIHEIALVPDNLEDQVKQSIEERLSQAIHVGARPLTRSEWFAVLQKVGFSITQTDHAPMALLQIGRILVDEGIFRTIRIFFNLLRDRKARWRVLQMRGAFASEAHHLEAISIIARK